MLPRYGSTRVHKGTQGVVSDLGRTTSPHTAKRTAQ